jgi:hypothetical protein
MLINRIVLVGGLLCAALVVAGCSESYGGRMEVSGSVKLKGQPIKDGALVMFEPLEKQDTAVNATTTGGAYTVPRQSGLKPGKYLVRISAGDGKTPLNPTNPDEPPGPGGGGANIVSKELVPAKWNRNSKEEVTVTKDGPNKFDFDIN